MEGLFTEAGQRHFWWEDAWAAFALIADVNQPYLLVACLACTWLDARIGCSSNVHISPAWILAVAFTSVMWAARMSVIFSIIRIANHSGRKIYKQVTYLIAVSFTCMWAALVAQKLSLCQFHACQMATSVALSHLIDPGTNTAHLGARQETSDLDRRPVIDLPRSLYEYCHGADSRGDGLRTYNDGADWGPKPNMEDASVSYAEEGTSPEAWLATLKDSE
ncbi:hypothetical protein EDB19DRAFT_1833232 [Suillus lakei]|nr:hypothetical protein EDB19DRAFT_1833232 [Suillus lakei]